MKNSIVITAIVAIIIGAGAFFGGMKYQESKAASARGQFGQQGGQGGARGQFGRNGGGGGRPVAGEIISSDDKSITVKLQDGSSKIVLLTDTTSINKSATGSKSDLKVGERVGVFGMTNSDGSVTAQSIQLNPQLMGGARGGPTPNQSQKSSDAKEIMVEGSNYKFSPATITVKKGQKTRILFKNSGGNHDFRVDELNVATAVIRGGEEDFVEFTPEKTGQYEFYCSVDGHRQMGMKGTMIVE